MIIGDLHIHSRFSRACSTAITLDNLEKYAKIKGLNLLGTGDFTHPKWINEVKENLKEDENGILWSKTGFPFLWQTEVSLMYSQGGKGRRMDPSGHNAGFLPKSILDFAGSSGKHFAFFDIFFAAACGSRNNRGYQGYEN